MECPGSLLSSGSIEAEALSRTVSRMILSASGWRTVFAADGDEQSTTPAVSSELLVVASLAARCYAELCVPANGHCARANGLSVAVGSDTRPTGAAIVAAVIRTLVSLGIPVRHCGIAASPEIMAYAASNDAIGGFFYVSASHNPVGHNGVKMGGGDGGVFAERQATELIERFRSLAADARAVDLAVATLRSQPGQIERAIYARTERTKSESLDTYLTACRSTVIGPGPRAHEAWNALTRALRDSRVGVVADLNGSARAASIDSDFFSGCGMAVHSFNATPGVIAHQIVPEGPGLDACRAKIEELAGDPQNRYEIGYVPDNDGDRGNLVIMDRSTGQARSVPAQTVFALACAAELCWLVTTGALPWPRGDAGAPPRGGAGAPPSGGAPTTRTAIVANGPTSLRIDRIAEIFGVEIHRAEVGEANVVSRARELRDEGYLVRILGEGSNGGNITHPSAVRDPLHSVLSAMKLAHGAATASTPSPAEVWYAVGGLPLPAVITLVGLIDSLPEFTTTSAFEERAVMQIGAISHADLKRTLEARLDDEFTRIAARLAAELGVASYEVTNYEGTVERRGAGNRTGHERGGFKIELFDSNAVKRGFLWMRGSGTEPVFRIMVDVEGRRPELEAELLDWLREVVEASCNAGASPRV